MDTVAMAVIAYTFGNHRYSSESQIGKNRMRLRFETLSASLRWTIRLTIMICNLLRVITDKVELTDTVVDNGYSGDKKGR